MGSAETVGGGVSLEWMRRQSVLRSPLIAHVSKIAEFRS